MSCPWLGECEGGCGRLLLARSVHQMPELHLVIESIHPFVYRFN
jgi:hypothetical protein